MGAQYLPDSVGVSALPHGRVVLEGLAGVELAGGVVQVRELHHLEHILLCIAWNEERRPLDVKLSGQAAIRHYANH